MALTLTFKQYLSIDAKTLRVVDKTGAYSATNLTGWGAPNVELAQSALFAVAILKGSTSNQNMVANSGTLVVFDPSAIASKETPFIFTFLNDGVVDVTLGRLRVASGGNTVGTAYLGGGTIANGDYYYYNGFIYHMVGGVPSVVSTNELLDHADVITQTTVACILAPRLAIVKSTLYKEYVLKRVSDEDEAKELFREILELSEDIKGAYYSFYCNLKLQAQSQIESLLNQYNLTNQ